MNYYYDNYYNMYPSGQNFSSNIPTIGTQNFLQALHAQHAQQYQSNQENQQASNTQRQQSQIPPTTTTQNQPAFQQQSAAIQPNHMAYLAAIQQQLTQQQLNQNEQAKALAQIPYIQALLNSPELLSKMHPHQIQLLQNQIQAAATNASRPSLMSNFPVHNNASQLNINNLIKQEPKQMYGLTAGIPHRSGTNNLPVPNALMRTPDITTSPALNRANTLVSNMHAAQPTTHLQVDGPTTKELHNTRDRIDKLSEEHKQLDNQFTTITKKKHQLAQMLQHRKEQMKREKEEDDAAEAILRAAALANAEANKSKVSLIDRIALENRQQADKNRPPAKLLPQTKFCHNLESIANNFKKFAPMLIKTITESKLKAQIKREEYLVEYDDKYNAWARRSEKCEKTSKKIEKAQRNRELFEKTFPEIKRDREERERNERHERNNSEDQPAKTKEYIIPQHTGVSLSNFPPERACHVPFYCPQRPKHTFHNFNNLVDEQEYKRANDDLSNFLSEWTQAEKAIFANKIKTYWKNFYVLSNFFWNKTTSDMVRFFYATKAEMKYKLTFPKAKKKIAKSYKPVPMPEPNQIREMYDHLMTTCDQKSTFRKMTCLICCNDVHLFADNLPKMKPEKERLRHMIIKEQEYREKMPICNKCYNAFKKASLRCPVGECGKGRRRNKPSRALPTEFLELPVEEQCLVVRKLHFHPATPKICNNCYKRIIQEIKCIRSNTFSFDGSLGNEHTTDNKKQLKWTFDRVESLFRSAFDSDKNWDAVSSQLYVENFKPSARQCRSVYTKLSNYWHIKKRRDYLEKSSRKLRKMYRRIKRATKLGKVTDLSNLVSSKSPNNAFEDKRQSTDSMTPSSRFGSITQGIPALRTPISQPANHPLLANFIPTASQPTTSAMASMSSSAMSALSTMGIPKQLMTDDLLDELGLAKDGSATDSEIIQRFNKMSPYEFERLSNRFKTRAQQDQAVSNLAKFNQYSQFDQKEQDLRNSDNQMRTNQSPRIDTHMSSVLQYSASKSHQLENEESSRHSASVERPNRKTGLANVMLESNNSGFRSRSHTLQKTNRSSSAFDSQNQPAAVKLEHIEPALDIEDVKLRQNNSIQHQQIQQRPTDFMKTEKTINDDPVYESLSDDDDNSISKGSKPQDVSAQRNQKPRWRQLYTIFTLADTDRIHIPQCPQHFSMPSIESIHTTFPYEDLSD